MHLLDTWEQTAIYNPADPTQRKIEKYAGVPGAYASFYFNRVPNPGQLMGLQGSGVVTWRGLIFYGLLTYAGLWAAKRFGVTTRVRRLFTRRGASKPVKGLGWLFYGKRR